MDFFMEFVTNLGDTSVLGPLSILVAAIFYFRRELRFLKIFLMTMLGTVFSVQVLKILIERPRPVAALFEDSYSFPSGHSSAITAFLGFFICMVILDKKTKRRTRFLLVAILSVVVLAVSYSRIYLGLHYTSDVVAGIVVALLWLLISFWFGRRLSAR